MSQSSVRLTSLSINLHSFTFFSAPIRVCSRDSFIAKPKRAIVTSQKAIVRLESSSYRRRPAVVTPNYLITITTPINATRLARRGLVRITATSSP